MASTEINNHDGIGATFLLVDGLLQLAGLTMLVVGAALPSHLSASLTLAPLVTNSGAGVGFSGRF